MVARTLNEEVKKMETNVKDFGEISEKISNLSTQQTFIYHAIPVKRDYLLRERSEINYPNNTPEIMEHYRSLINDQEKIIKEFYQKYKDMAYYVRGITTSELYMRGINPKEEETNSSIGLLAIIPVQDKYYKPDLDNNEIARRAHSLAEEGICESISKGKEIKFAITQEVKYSVEKLDDLDGR